MLKKFAPMEVDKHFTLKAMTIAAFAGLGFGTSSAYAEELLTPGQPTLDKLGGLQTSGYTVVDDAADSNTGISFTQYTYDNETHKVVSQEKKYININKATYSNGDLTYSWNDENQKLTVTKSGNAAKVNGVEYVGNATSGDGGAINNTNGTMGDITGDFIGNTGVGNYSGGGAISNHASSANTTANINSITGNFVGNYAYSGGAIDIHGNSNNATVSIGSIKGDFIGNSSRAAGGAIDIDAHNGAFDIGSITGDFINNSTQGGAFGGGAINLYTYRSTGHIGSITGNFIGNTAPNESGGAMDIYGDGITIDSITGDFIGNFAKSAGAITNSSTIKALTGDFIGNFVTTGSSGAISNYKTITNLTGNFINNSAVTDAGAIWNYYGKIETLTGDFVNNTAAGGNGGAINNTNARIETLTGDFVNNSASNDGGAIYSFSQYSYSHANIGSITGDFIGNTANGNGGAYYSGSDSPYSTMTGQIKGNFVDNSAGESGGAIWNSRIIAPITGDFNNNTANRDGGAIYNYSKMPNSGAHINSINGNFTENTATNGNGGAIWNTGTLEAVTGNFTNNTAGGQGGAIYNMRISATDNMLKYYNYSSAEEMALDIGFNSVEDMLDGYDSIEQYLEAHDYPPDGTFVYYMEGDGDGDEDGYIFRVDDLVQDMGYSSVEELLANEEVYSSLDDMAKRKGFEDYGEITFVGENTLSNNKANGELNDIYNSGKITLAQDATVTSNSGIDGEEGVIYLEPNSTLNVNHYLKGQKVNIDNATINIGAIKQADNSITYGSVDLSALTVTANGGMYNAVNNHIAKHNFGDVTLNGNLNMTADVDLAKEKMDSVKGKSYSGTGNINVVGMNLLSDTNKKEVNVLFANKVLKDHITSDVKEVGKGADSKWQTKAYAPIYKYDVKYENRDDAGYFVFKRPGGGSDEPVVPISTHFNPAVLASPVAAQAGASATMSQTLNFAFEHGDTFMNFSSMDRFAKTHDNVYAMSTDFNENLGRIDLSHEDKSVWVKPYSVFENIKLKNGPKVDTISYGTLIGFDSNIHRLKKGWYNVGTGYIGYNGSQIDYTGVDASVNGGLIGLTETFYKGNFWTALTATAGGAGAEAHTMYGKDDMGMLMAGIGSKTGYNFEFADGKFIIQPRMFVAYSMIKTFDYTNAAGVRIDSDPMHTIQINPAIKVIGNTKNGWQPYASVGMMWNLLNETDATANGIKLPEMHTKPYVEYGLGVQKLWNDKYSAYGQAMVRNGGRTGVALTLGFRMALGEDGKPIEKTQKTPETTTRTSMFGVMR